MGGLLSMLSVVTIEENVKIPVVEEAFDLTVIPLPTVASTAALKQDGLLGSSSVKIPKTYSNGWVYLVMNLIS